MEARESKMRKKIDKWEWKRDRDRNCDVGKWKSERVEWERREERESEMKKNRREKK